MRRDGHAFALLCSFALVLALLQPLLAAPAPSADGFVICTMQGIAPQADAGDGGRSLPAGGSVHQCCLSGPLCGGLPLLDKAHAAAVPAFAPPAATSLAAWPDRPGHPPRAAGSPAPPPARAPPSA